MGGVGKCFGVALTTLGGISVVFGIVSIFLCQSEVKYAGAPIWSGFFLMVTGAIGLATAVRPKSNGWLTSFLVLSLLSLMVVFCSFAILISGIAADRYSAYYDYEESYNDIAYPDHLNWPDFPHMFGDYSYSSSSSSSSSAWDGEFDGVDDLLEHLNLPDGWNTRPDEMQEWLEGLATQDLEDLDLPGNWEDMYASIQDWLNEHRDEETEGEDDVEPRHRHGGDHRPIHRGDMDGDDWTDYSSYSYEWGHRYGRHVSMALYGVTIILAFIELIVLFTGAVASCCGLCNSTPANATTVRQTMTHQPQVYILQPGQTVLPQTNGQFIIVQRPPSYGNQNFTPSTNPALDAFPTKEPTNRLPPLDLEQADPLPEKVELA